MDLNAIKSNSCSPDLLAEAGSCFALQMFCKGAKVYKVFKNVFQNAIEAFVVFPFRCLHFGVPWKVEKTYTEEICSSCSLYIFSSCWAGYCCSRSPFEFSHWEKEPQSLWPAWHADSLAGEQETAFTFLFWRISFLFFHWKWKQIVYAKK